MKLTVIISLEPPVCIYGISLDLPIKKSMINIEESIVWSVFI